MNTIQKSIFDDVIGDIINNKIFSPIATELFIRGRKLKISLAFITQSYVKVSKYVRLNSKGRHPK